MKNRIFILSAIISAALIVGVTFLSEAGTRDRKESVRPANYAKSKRFKALMLWEPTAEIAHVQFDKQSMEFFHKLNYGDGFVLDTTTTLKGYTYEQLKEYSIIIALNASPSDAESRELFEKYMEWRRMAGFPCFRIQ